MRTSDELTDRHLQDEIALLTAMMLAAAETNAPMSPSQIDRALGLAAATYPTVGGPASCASQPPVASGDDALAVAPDQTPWAGPAARRLWGARPQTSPVPWGGSAVVA